MSGDIMQIQIASPHYECMKEVIIIDGGGKCSGIKLNLNPGFVKVELVK
jgi:hypothetical protein